MTNQINAIPTSEPIADKDGKVNLSWALFFQTLVQGDTGNKFKPDVQGLTGSATITGVYYQNSGFIDFYIRIVPDTTTSSTAGSTYVNLPFVVNSDSACFAVTGNTAGVGGIVAASQRAFFPAWSNLASPITVSGRVPSQ